MVKELANVLAAPCIVVKLAYCLKKQRCLVKKQDNKRYIQNPLY